MTPILILLAVALSAQFGVVAWMAHLGKSAGAQRITAGCATVAAVAVLAPNSWALLPLLAGGVAMASPTTRTHLAAAGATIGALLGVARFPGAELQVARVRQEYQGSGMSRAAIFGLKSDLRNLAAWLEVAHVDHGRYDALILAPKFSSSSSHGVEIILAATDSTWHAWARNDAMGLVCDLGEEYEGPACPVQTPIDSAEGLAPRLFSARWAQDSVPVDHWLKRLQSRRPSTLTTDSTLLAEGVQVTVTDSGWSAVREWANWQCTVGTRARAPAGVEPGGVICTARTITHAGGEATHAH